MQKNILLASALSIFLLSCVNNSSSTKTLPNTLKTNTPVALNSNTFTGKQLRLIGRFDHTTNGQAKFSWPGSALEFRFEGTQASINIASQTTVRFTVNIDGKINDLWIKDGNHHYSLAENLSPGTHTLRLTRVNESTAGVTAFISQPQVDGSLLTAPAAPQKQLLVIGDSITAGYGVEGAEASCHYALDTSNQQLTYAAVAANALGADLHAIAWSGIGAWRTYGEKTPISETILNRYSRTLGGVMNSTWNSAQYTPDAILINIGTNDYWEGSVSNDYRIAMTQLIAMVQKDYENKPIYLIVSPMLTNKLHEAQKQVLTSLTQAKVKVLDLGESTGAEGFGCDYHPNKITHARLAKNLEQSLKTELKW